MEKEKLPMECLGLPLQDAAVLKRSGWFAYAVITGKEIR